MNNLETFLRKTIEAFSEGDEKFLLENVTNDICWKIVGERTLSGRSQFSDALEQMRGMPPMKIEVDNVILDNKAGIIEGIVTGRNRLGQEKQFGFCDVYRLADSDALKIKNITSYVIDISRHKRYRESC